MAKNKFYGAVSAEEYKREYLSAMEVPQVFPCVDAVDIYEGFSRHRNLNRTLGVESQTLRDMVHVNDVGLFQRVTLEELANAFDISDTEPVKEFLRDRWGNSIGASKTVLVADFQAYIEQSRAKIFEVYPENNSQPASSPFLRINRIALPEYFRQKGGIPISLLKDVYTAISADLKETALLPKNRRSGLVSQRYRNLAFIEEQREPGEEYLPIRKALKATKPYLDYHRIKQAAEYRHVATITRNGHTFYNFADLKKLIDEQRVAKEGNISKRAVERELAKSIPHGLLSKWVSAGVVSYTAILGVVGNSDYEKVEQVRDQLEQVGVKVSEINVDHIFEVIKKNINLEPPKNKVDDAIQYYFKKVANVGVMSAEKQKEICNTMKEHREKFMYLTLRNPHTAAAVAKEILSLIESKDLRQSTSVFDCDAYKASVKMGAWKSVTARLELRAQRAAKLETALKEKTGKSREYLLKEYECLEDEVVQIYRMNTFRPRTIVPIVSRYVADKPRISSLDHRREAIKSYAIYRESRDTLVLQIAKLSAFWAKKYATRGKHGSFTDRWIDLISHANIGAMTAVDKWDPEIGKLTTYASWWIKQSITRYIDEVQGLGLRRPIHIAELIYRYNKEVDKFIQTNYQEPSINDIAERMGMTPWQMCKLRGWAKRFSSIDNAISEDDDSAIGDFLGRLDPRLESAGEALNNQELWGYLKTFLKPKQLQVIRERFVQRRTLEEVGEIMKVTRERVRQIEKVALERLRHPQHKQVLERIASSSNVLDETKEAEEPGSAANSK
jgi:RNA polymerase sigma factor (sigma-70 family)